MKNSTWEDPAFPEELDAIVNGEPREEDMEDLESPPDKPPQSLRRPKSQDLIRQSYPKKSSIQKILGKEIVALSVTAGILMMVFGAIIIPFNEIRSIQQTSENENDVLETYTNTTHTTAYRIGHLLFNVGTFLAAVPLILLGMFSTGIQKEERLGYFVLAGLIILSMAIIS